MEKSSFFLEKIAKVNKILYNKLYAGGKINIRGDWMKRIQRTITLVLLLVSVFATSVFAAPSTTTMKNQKNQAEKEVKTLQQELTDIMTEMNRTEQKLVAKGEAIIDATERLEKAKKNEEKQYNNMVKRIVLMYENGNSNMMEMILESGSLSEMLQNVENVQALHSYDRKELQEYIAVKEEIANLKVTLETEQKELQKLQVSLESQKKSLDTKIAAKKKEISDLDAKIAEAARIAAEEARKKAEEEASKKNQNQIVVNNNVGKGDQSVGNAIVAAARSYIGVWYLWGGNDRNGIDCSGLTKACHKAVGITIDRWSGHQAIGGKAIGDGKEDLDKALPGDIICYPGHVAIYIGNYRVIHAPCTGKKVQEASVYLGGKTITAIRRYW